MTGKAPPSSAIHAAHMRSATIHGAAGQRPRERDTTPPGFVAQRSRHADRTLYRSGEQRNPDHQEREGKGGASLQAAIARNARSACPRPCAGHRGHPRRWRDQPAGYCVRAERTRHVDPPRRAVSRVDGAERARPAGARGSEDRRPTRCSAHNPRRPPAGRWKPKRTRSELRLGHSYWHPDKPRELWINEVGVAPAWRQLGVGTKLLKKTLEHARAPGCREAWVLTEPDNVAALALYSKLGGVRSGPTSSCSPSS